MGAGGEEFLTVADIARILKLNQQTVRNWIFSPVFRLALVLSGFEDGASTHQPWAG